MMHKSSVMVGLEPLWFTALMPNTATKTATIMTQYPTAAHEWWLQSRRPTQQSLQQPPTLFTFVTEGSRTGVSNGSPRPVPATRVVALLFPLALLLQLGSCSPSPFFWSTTVAVAVAVAVVAGACKLASILTSPLTSPLGSSSNSICRVGGLRSAHLQHMNWLCDHDPDTYAVGGI